MSCQAIQAESRANSLKISELGSEQGAKTAQNVAAGVAGLFIWPLWFAMDFQGAATKEIAALEARNAHLGERALQTCLASAQFETGAGATLPIADAVRAPAIARFMSRVSSRCCENRAERETGGLATARPHS